MTATPPVRTGEGLPAIHDCAILVVDDTDFNRTLIGALLTEAGFRNLIYAKDGFEALDRIEAAPPDLVILDIMMPGMDGYEVCRRLRADPASADVPVLVQTALSGTEDRNKAFAVGTTDLVSKPIDRAELLARVRIHLENRLLIRDLQHYRSRVEGELAIARSMYDHMLPNAGAIGALKRDHGVDLLSHTVLSSEVGGGIWGVHPLAPGRVGVYLLDVAGRGVSAALNAFRMHTLVQELLSLAEEPDRLLSELNDRAMALLARGDRASVVYGVIDGVAETFTYAAAAATDPLVLCADGSALMRGSGAGAPLGDAGGTRFESRQLPFKAGSVLVLHNRAVLRALGSGPAPVEEGGLDAAITRALIEAPLADAFATVAASLCGPAGQPPAEDHAMLWLCHGR